MAFDGGYAVSSLTNLESGETLFFQFEPETLTRRIDVAWGTELPVGGTHEVAVYNGTRSERIPLRLFYTSIGGLGKIASAALTVRPGSALAGEEDPGERLLEVERFLSALCYPDQDHIFQAHGFYDFARNDFGSRTSLRQVDRPPPLVEFISPSILRIRGHVESLGLTYERLNATDLSPLVLVADVTLREDLPLNRRLQGGEIRRNGAQRGHPQSNLPARSREIRQEPITVRTSFGSRIWPAFDGP